MGYPLRVLDNPPPAPEATCPVCSEPTRVGPTCVCMVCRTPHHQSCWDYNRRCGIFGCRARLSEASGRELDAQGLPVLERTMSAGNLGLLLVGSLVFGWAPGALLGAVFGGEALVAGLATASYMLAIFLVLPLTLAYRVRTSVDANAGVLRSVPSLGATFPSLAWETPAEQVLALELEREAASGQHQAPGFHSGYLVLISGERVHVWRRLHQDLWMALADMMAAAEALDVPVRLGPKAALAASPQLEAARRLLGR